MSLLFLSLLSPVFASAQLSFSSAVDLALRNSPKLKIAQADVDRARSLVSQARDAYIPSVIATGGIGKSVRCPPQPPGHLQLHRAVARLQLLANGLHPGRAAWS